MCKTKEDVWKINKVHEAEYFLRSQQFLDNSRNSQHFMEYEGSLPCSPETAIGPYPEPD
jgi:hypothetical protein